MNIREWMSENVSYRMNLREWISENESENVQTTYNNCILKLFAVYTSQSAEHKSVYFKETTIGVAYPREELLTIGALQRGIT